VQRDAHVRVAGAEIDVEDGGSDAKGEGRGFRPLGVGPRCCTSGGSKFSALHREGDGEQDARDAGSRKTYTYVDRSGYMKVWSVAQHARSRYRNSLRCGGRTLTPTALQASALAWLPTPWWRQVAGQQQQQQQPLQQCNWQPAFTSHWQPGVFRRIGVLFEPSFLVTSALDWNSISWFLLLPAGS
jgi:hypothetical protein